MKTHLTICILVLILCSAIAIAGDSTEQSALEPSITVNEVLKRYIDAVGGRDAIEKLTTRVSSGRLITNLPSREPPVYDSTSFETYAGLLHRYLMISTTPDGVERAGFDGKIGWRQNADGIKRDEQPLRSKPAWLFDPQGALHITDYFPDLTVTGMEQIFNRPVYLLESKDLEQAQYGLYFDVASGLLLRIGYYWDLQDYRTVDDVLIPHRVVTSRKGGSSTYHFDEVKHNVALNDSLFVMPTEPKQ
ncbi:MAG: hypothetical protein ABII79_08350 [bacterium]